MRETDELVARGYDRVADAYAALEGEAEWPRAAWLGDLLGRLPPAARALDLGCGSGVPALRSLADHGHSVVGLDISSEQLARAQVNVPEAELVQASALDLELPPGSLDVVVAFYVADHLPRETLPALLTSIRRWLRVGGWLLITFETGDQPDAVGTWLGEPMFFSHYDAATNERLVREAGFEITRAEVQSQLEGTNEVDYLWLLARNPKPAAGTTKNQTPGGLPLVSPTR